MITLIVLISHIAQSTSSGNLISSELKLRKTCHAIVISIINSTNSLIIEMVLSDISHKFSLCI